MTFLRFLTIFPSRAAVTDEELDSNDNDVEDNTLEKLGDSLGTATTPEEARQFATAIADQFSNLCLEAEKNLNKVFDPETGDLRCELTSFHSVALLSLHHVTMLAEASPG